MSKILSGETQQTRLLPTIARALGVSVAYLTGESAEPVVGMAAGVLSADESVFLTQVRVLSTTDRRSVFRILNSLAQTPGFTNTWSESILLTAELDEPEATSVLTPTQCTSA